MADPQTVEELARRGFRYALALTHDESRAEDLVQDAWVSLLAADGPRHAGYLFRIIRNRFIDLYRRERLVAMEPLPAEVLESGRGLEPMLEDDLLADTLSLEKALETLRPEEREVLFLAAVEEYTAREVADLTGRPRGTVLSLVHRARAKLRRVLGVPTEGGWSRHE